MILVRRFVATLLAVGVLAIPAVAAADGIMLVQAGAFWMGRDDGPPDEAPRHRVYVRDVWIERHKVTNAEFALFLNMLGNLREWTSTALRPYPYKSDDGREPYTGATGRVVVRGASHDDPAESLGVTRRRSYDRRGAAAGHHVVGFRYATSEDLGEMAPGGRSR